MGWGFLLCGFIFDHLAKILRSVLVIMVLQTTFLGVRFYPGMYF